MNPLGKVSAGQKFPTSAQRWNAVFAAAEAFQRGQFRPPAPPVASGFPRDEIQVINDSGEDLPRFAVVGLDGFPAIAGTRLDPFDESVRTEPARFLSDDLPICSAILPVSGQHANSMAILLEALPPLAIGRALLVGATPVKVEIRSHQHQFADIRHDDPTQLVSVPLGPHRILGRPTPTFLGTDTGTGPSRWCLVQLGGGRRQEWFPWRSVDLTNAVVSHGLLQMQPLFGAGALISHQFHAYARPPGGYGPGQIAVNSGAQVGPGGTGWATFDEGPLSIAWEPTSGTPEVQDVIGPHTLALGGYVGSEARRYCLGFRVVAPAETYSGQRIVSVIREDQTTVYGELSGGSAAAFAVRRFNAATNTDVTTGQVLDCAPRVGGDAYPAGTVGMADWVANYNGWIVSALVCGG